MVNKAKSTNEIVNKMDDIERDFIKIESNMQSYDILISSMMPSIEHNSLSILENESSIKQNEEKIKKSVESIK